MAHLTRVNRRWSRSGTLGVLALAIIALTAQVVPPSRVLEVEQLVLRDASGRVRVALSALDDDAIVLTFRDRLERDRLAIGLLPDGEPLVGFYDEYRRRRAAVGMLGPDVPGLLLYGQDGTVLWQAPSPEVAR